MPLKLNILLIKEVIIKNTEIVPKISKRVFIPLDIELLNISPKDLLFLIDLILFFMSLLSSFEI